MKYGTGNYTVSFRVRPLTDLPLAGSSNYANLQVVWTDDLYPYQVSVDLDQDDGGALTTGAITYGGDGMGIFAGGIDWSSPRTIDVRYAGSENRFYLYVDGVLQTFVPDNGIIRQSFGGFTPERVSFGDTTTGQGVDQAAEWYFVQVSTMIPEPSSVVLLAVGGLILRVAKRKNRS